MQNTEYEDIWNSDDVEIHDLPLLGDGDHFGQRVSCPLWAWVLQDPRITLRKWRWPIVILIGLAVMILLLLLSNRLAGLWESTPFSNLFLIFM